MPLWIFKEKTAFNSSDNGIWKIAVLGWQNPDILFTFILIINEMQLDMTTQPPIPAKASPLQLKVDSILRDLRQAKDHQERSKYRQEIYALGVKSAPALLPHLNDEDDFLRWDLVSFLGEFAHPETLESVVKFALSESEVHARWRSFWAVTRFDKDKIIPLLIKALKSKRAEKQWGAALILNMLNREEALPQILKGLKSKDHWVQWEALSALKAYGKKGTEDAVGAFIKKTYSRDLRQEAALALGNIGTPKAIRYLKKALNDPSHHVRWRASFSLASMDNPAVIPILKKHLKSEKDQEVIEQLEQDIKGLKRFKNGTKKNRSYSN